MSMTTTSIKKNLDNLRMPDVYSLMLFVLYKIQDIPEYDTLSKLCYLTDSRSLTRILAFFAGKTIKIPTEHEFKILSNAILLYKKINLDGVSFATAIKDLSDITADEYSELTTLYLKIIPIMNDYTINIPEMK